MLSNYVNVLWVNLRQIVAEEATHVIPIQVPFNHNNNLFRQKSRTQESFEIRKDFFTRILKGVEHIPVGHKQQGRMKWYNNVMWRGSSALVSSKDKLTLVGSTIDIRMNSKNSFQNESEYCRFFLLYHIKTDQVSWEQEKKMLTRFNFKSKTVLALRYGLSFFGLFFTIILRSQ